MAEATLLVCTTCRREGWTDGPRDGARMLEALDAASLPAGLRIRPVECLSACTQGCAIALSAPGKWTYVYGRLDPGTDAAAILDGAARYAASADGIVPWRERPEIFRKQSLARIPPLETEDV
jgi:predicted metal-binding protein